MAKTVPAQIRIDSEVKHKVNTLFRNLGMDMSGAVNIFLRQCILRNRRPLNVEIPACNQETLITEAKRISRNPDVPGYTKRLSGKLEKTIEPVRFCAEGQKSSAAASQARRDEGAPLTAARIFSIFPQGKDGDE